MPGTPASLSYRLGLAVLRGVPDEEAPSWLVYDDRLGALVAPGHRFVELRAWADANGIPESAPPDELDAPLLDPRTPRPYQREAVDRWREIPDLAVGALLDPAVDLEARRLGFIRSAQAAGFTLDEIAELLRLDAGGDRPRAREMARDRIAALDARIAELQRAREALSKLAKECAAGGKGPCPIIASFS